MKVINLSNQSIMKNILGTTENLDLYNKEGVIVYEFKKHSNGGWYERTYHLNGNVLTHKDSDGYWYERTYHSNGSLLTHKESNGFSYEHTLDLNGNTLNFKNSKGFWFKYTRDSNGNTLTYKDSNGKTRGFDIPEYTMEELVEKLGNFKIKK